MDGIIRPKRTGYVMSRTLEFLEQKAKLSKWPGDVNAYSTLREISDSIQISYIQVNKTLGILVKNGQVRIYPNENAWRRLFGSSELPPITMDDILRQWH